MYEIRLAEVEGQHWYDCHLLRSIVRYPSVTTILGAYPKGEKFYEWVAKHGADSEAIKREAGDVGHTIHTAIESIIREKHLPGLSLADSITIAAFREWYEKTKPIPVCCERKIVSASHAYAGTTDLVCLINGQTCLVDYKTSNFISIPYWLQVNAYAVALEEMGLGPIERLAILHLNRSYPAGYKFLVRRPSPVLFDQFLRTYDTWRFDRENGKSANSGDTL